MSEAQKENLKELVDIVLNLEPADQKAMIRFGHDLQIIREVKNESEQ